MGEVVVMWQEQAARGESIGTEEAVLEEEALTSGQGPEPPRAGGAIGHLHSFYGP